MARRDAGLGFVVVVTYPLLQSQLLLVVISEVELVGRNRGMPLIQWDSDVAV